VPVIVLQLRDIRPSLDDRPSHCPNCGSDLFQRWGSSNKIVQDTSYLFSSVYRFRCSSCGHIFRHYPPKIDHTNLTPRIRKLAALAWALGLSSREVVAVFAGLGIELSHMTVWRDGHDLVSCVNDESDPNRPRRYLIDKLFLKNKSRGIGTSIVLDLGQSKTAILGKIAEPNPRVVMSWLKPFIDELDVEVLLFGTGVLQNFEQQ
jgi:hypothetical protein